MLVMAESDRYERFDERRNVVPARITGIRYVKHLVWIAARRNSFHVAIALCRLLFDYSTPETMAIYDPLLAEGEFLKEDYYYRARKRILMREIEHRFPDIVRVQRARAEERFAAESDQEAWLDVVRATLEQCTPWGTSCPGDPARLAVSSDAADAELARLHVLIHPPCFEALVARAGLEPPGRRLAMPRFHSKNATVGEAPVRRMTSAGLDAGPTCSQQPPA